MKIIILSRRQMIKLGLLAGSTNVESELLAKAGVPYTRATGASTIRFEVLSEGFVDKRDPEGPRPLTCLPRTVITKEGELVCTYVVSPKIGSNDHVPFNNQVERLRLNLGETGSNVATFAGYS